jgi:hypothetical protein
MLVIVCFRVRMFFVAGKLDSFRVYRMSYGDYNRHVSASEEVGSIGQADRGRALLLL